MTLPNTRVKWIISQRKVKTKCKNTSGPYSAMEENKFFELLSHQLSYVKIDRSNACLMSKHTAAMNFPTVDTALFLLMMLLSPLFISCDQTTLKQSLDPSPFPSNFLFGTSTSSYQVWLLVFLLPFIFLCVHTVSFIILSIMETNMIK